MAAEHSVMHTKMTDSFSNKEDKDYFDSLFQDFGGLPKNIDLFDFREPQIKRKEFNKIRSKIFQDLKSKFGSVCQLKCHQDCTNSADEVDHLIPLSSNVLNKQLRGFRANNGKKAPTQSFGSNHPTNFVLSCTRCNAFKNNKIPTIDMIKYVFDSGHDDK